MTRRKSTKSQKGRRRSTRRRSVSRSRSKAMRYKLPSCKYGNELDALVKLNSISWDVQTEPDSINADILDYPWCSGEIKLLLPIVKVNDSTSLIVYYQEKIRQKTITLGDILDKIYTFYHHTKIIPGDLTYISVADTMKDFAETALQAYYTDTHSIDRLRFVHFLSDQTKFAGLKHQRDNIYSLKLVTQ